MHKTLSQYFRIEQARAGIATAVVLIALVLFSSCAVRKGIETVFGSSAPVAKQSTGLKSQLLPMQAFAAGTCNVAKSEQIFTSYTAMDIVLKQLPFLLIFTALFCVVTALSQQHVFVGDSKKLRFSSVPLFIRNGLLLI
ncbi:hypothetical protein [Pedobacter suwonensis]|uniref:hypothetical protein n=1 Tax=Pedobacter suwonensis TaxID=332999 RepID=UPI0036CED309